MDKFLAIVFTTLAVAGCSSGPAQFNPVLNSPSTQFIRTNTVTGGKFVLSTASGSRLGLMQVKDKAYDRWGPTFQVKLVAEGSSSFRFGVDNVSVRQDGNYLEVFGAKEIAKAIREERGKTEFLMTVIKVMGALSNTLAASNPTPMSASTISTNNAAILIATDSTLKSSADGRAFSSAVAKTHLSDVSVFSGQELAALISIPDLDDDDPAEFEFQVGNDRHKIVFVPK